MTKQMPRRGQSPGPLSNRIEYRFATGSEELLWFVKNAPDCTGHVREDWAEECADLWDAICRAKQNQAAFDKALKEHDETRDA